MLVLGLVDVVVGFAAISSAALITGADDTSGLRILGGVMIFVGVAQLVGAAAVWVAGRSRRKP